MTSVELCPKCHTSIALTSYTFSFEDDFARAYRNPTQSEVSCIEKGLSNPSTEMAALAQEIKRVESMLDALKAHHEHLNMYIQRSMQYMRCSAICRLPTEVLGIIFASACTSFQRSEYKTPLSISLVCSKWRDIALSTPSLWTHIYVAPYSGGLDVYQHYLKRCRHIPISLKVEIPHKKHLAARENFPYEETKDYHLELVSPIYRNCAQWKVAELWMNLKDADLLRYPIQVEFPLLESLTFVNEGPPHLLQSGLFDKAPFLTSFTILEREGGTTGLDLFVDALPWRQLRQFCTRGDEDNLRYLNSEKNMTYLDSEFTDGNDRTLVLRPYFHNSHLNFGLRLFNLHVSALVLDSVVWTGALKFFFLYLTIPTLQSLTMIPPDPCATSRPFKPSTWISPFPALSQFLARSGCALQTFTIMMRGQFVDDIDDYHEKFFRVYVPGQPTFEDSLIAALHCMRDLRALRVIEAESGPSLFNERLFQEMAQGHLLPKLTSLEMVWAEDRQPVDALIPMLTSRAGQGGAGTDTLSSVVLGVRSGGDLRSDVLDCMANLRQQGIQATLW